MAGKRENESKEGRKRETGEECEKEGDEWESSDLAKKTRKRHLAMLPDLLCLDRLHYVSCAVRLSLSLIRSHALLNLSVSRFACLFWVLFCFPLPSVNIVLFG